MKSLLVLPDSLRQSQTELLTADQTFQAAKKNVFFTSIYLPCFPALLVSISNDLKDVHKLFCCSKTLLLPKDLSELP